jgi:hypothetical protein
MRGRRQLDHRVADLTSRLVRRAAQTVRSAGLDNALAAVTSAAAAITGRQVVLTTTKFDRFAWSMAEAGVPAPAGEVGGPPALAAAVSFVAPLSSRRWPNLSTFCPPSRPASAVRRMCQPFSASRGRRSIRRKSGGYGVDAG